MTAAAQPNEPRSGETVRVEAVVPQPCLAGLARLNLLRPYVYQQLVSETVVSTPVSPDLFAKLEVQFRQTNGLRDAAAVTAFRARLGWTEDDYRWQVELPHRINAHSQEHFSAKAEARFLDRKTQLDQVVYSLLRVEDAALARELYSRIEEGEATFAELAEQFSQGGERSSKGLVGPAPLGQAHPLLVKKLRSASPGTLMPPFQIEQWWLVVRLEKTLPAVLDEATRQRMAQELFDEWLQEEVSRRITSLTTTPLASQA